jgi:major membrane immunogen (membrane-anchored lipoprotein)
MMSRSVALIILALSVSACGNSDSSSVTVPDGKGGTANISSKADGDRSEVTMTGADGKTVKMSSDVKQANFPAFAPQYPGSTITSATQMSTDGKTMSTVTMTSPDKVDAVVEFYKASVTKAGMPIGMTGTFDGAGALQAGDSKDEKAPSIMVSAAPKDGITEISLIMTNVS